MNLRHLLFLPALLLAACTSVDTTGLTPELQSGPHPRSTANAAVAVRVYSDLQCPACKGAHELIDPVLLQTYGAQISFEFLHMPLSSIHPLAFPAAEAAECAADQGKFWEFVDLAYAEQDQISFPMLDTWGETLGLDTQLYRRCRASHIKRDAIQDSFQVARDANVGGTPTYLVNGVQVSSTFDALSRAIEEAGARMRERL